VTALPVIYHLNVSDTKDILRDSLWW